MPSFDNENLQEYINSYNTCVKQYIEAMESKDMAIVQKLATQGAYLSAKEQAFINICEDDIKELQEIAMNAAQ